MASASVSYQTTSSRSLVSESTSHIYEYQPSRRFYHVGGEDLECMAPLTEIFHRILTPLYGSQDKALSQIKEGKDRTCFLMYEGNTPVGVLVFKTVLSNEFAEFGVKESVEVKSLFVDQSAKNSGRGLGSTLVDKLKEEVSKLQLGEEAIHVTVSETKEDSLAFFRKKGFEIAHSWKGRYIPGVTEYLLSCPTRIAANGAAANPLAASQERLEELRFSPALPENEDRVPELVHIIHKAHFGRIHTLKALTDGTFLSGSEDNSIYKWGDDGSLVSVVTEVEPHQQDERNWVTALAPFNDNYFLSGHRDGGIHLWRTSGEYVKPLGVTLPSSGHVCNRYNTFRPNCLAPGLDTQNPSLFVGFPTLFDEYELFSGQTISTTQTHKNDWVYGIHPVSMNRLLVVTGCVVQIWIRQMKGWALEGTILSESKKINMAKKGMKPRFQRPFISALSPVKSSHHQFALAVFDGSVRVLDTESGSIISEWREHDDRVWDVVSISRHTLASGSSDNTVKLWDLRQKTSFHTIADRAGEVNSLLCLNENVLVTGVCPENPLAKGSVGAQIRFYDVRKA